MGVLYVKVQIELLAAFCTVLGGFGGFCGKTEDARLYVDCR